VVEARLSKERLEEGIRKASECAVLFPDSAYLTFVSYLQGWIDSMCGGLSEEAKAAIQAVHNADHTT